MYSVPGVTQLDSLELGRRQAIERDFESSNESLLMSNIVFDATDSFILFASLRGIKVVSLNTNNVVRIIGAGERAERFIHLALYQGVPQVDQQLLLARANGMIKVLLLEGRGLLFY